jgi:energy-coupling factor transporter ATP-binding protein EcfA2
MFMRGALVAAGHRLVSTVVLLLLLAINPAGNAATPINSGAGKEPSASDTGASSPSSPSYAAPGPLVVGAELKSLSPTPLFPNGSAMVTLDLLVTRPISQSAVADALRIYVDSVPAARIEVGGAPTALPAVSASPSSSPLGPPRFQTRITLFVRVPELPRALGLRNARVSVYSLPDQLEVASAEFKYSNYGQSSSLEFLADFVRLGEGPVWAAIILPVLIAFLVFYLARRSSSARIRDLESTVLVERGRVNALARSADPATVAPPRAGLAPVIPEDLYRALGRRDLVLVLGAGVSAQAGLPVGHALWLNLLDRYADKIPEAMADRETLVARGSSDRAAELVISLLGRDKVVEALIAELMRGETTSRLHDLIAGLQVPAFIDMTWDDRMSRALASASASEFVPSRFQGLSECLREGRLALIKPLGDLRQPDGVSLTQREYRAALGRAPEFERSLAALYTTKTLFFVGFSLEGIENFMNSLPPQVESPDQRHYALCADEPGVGDLWQTGYGRRFGVELLPFQPSADYREVTQMVEKLVERSRLSSISRGEHPAPISARLTYLEVESIGRFDRKLRLDFEPGWTLLLGDNGGGKSTLLRAAALALAGNDPRAVLVAGRLLRSGSDHARIELGITGGRILTTLARDGANVALTSPQVTALQAGQVLVLGFPALRGVSFSAVRGPTADQTGHPSVDDIGPLLQGAVDGRLDNLHQWLVNTALRAEKWPRGRESRMLDTFQELVSEMVPGGVLEYSHVDRSTWQVMFKAENVLVRFDSVSQGMSAILNWIGLLLQRLYETYPRSPKPEAEPAIVLIDEIDAHLHPEWQRRLVTLTRSHFPGVQVIASSHSPLLAGAMKRDELRIVAWDSAANQMSADRPKEELSGQKAEDILLSSLFSLSTTRSMEAERVIQEYFRLFQKLDPSDADRLRMAELKGSLNELNFGPDREQRQRLQENREEVERARLTVTPDSMKALQERLNSLASAAESPAKKP